MIFFHLFDRKKIEEAISTSKKKWYYVLLQDLLNIETEGGFLGAKLTRAFKFLLGIILGLLAGLAEAEVEGNAMFLGYLACNYHICYLCEDL